MSEEKQTRTKRVAPAHAAVIEVAPVLPPPAPIPALPGPASFRGPDFGGDKLFAAYRAALASFGASQAAFASDVAAMALEIGGLAGSGLTAAGDGIAALASARSLAEAVEIQLGFASRTLDAMTAGSTKLGEIGLRLANGAVKPILGSFPVG
jgi:hypothetical protein